MARGQLVAIGPPAQLAGRDALPTEIRFVLPEGAPLLPDLGGDVAVDGSAVLVRTGDSVRVLNRLTGWALERDVAIAGLAVSQPSLEDVYLSLTADSEISA
jgi:hypothetical protein